MRTRSAGNNEREGCRALEDEQGLRDRHVSHHGFNFSAVVYLMKV